MKTILEYLRLSLFVGGALIGVQIPSLVEQYGQRLESHLLESQTSLQGFQQDADKYFQGELAKLIQHYAKNTDPVINDGAESIDRLSLRAQFLDQSWSQFNASFQQRYWHAFISPVKKIRAETWNGYDFAVRLDASAIAWALSLGFILSALIEFCFQLILALLGLLRGILFGSAKNTKKPLTLHIKKPPALD